MSQFVYARGAHVPDVLIKGTTVYQMVTDHLGSVRLVINASTGTTLQRIDYDDWGTPTYVTGSVNDQPFAFAGGLWDPDTKLLHLGAREYDPQARRFITRDPSGFSGGWNLYSYAGNDPVNFVDPDGNTPWLAVAAVAAAHGFAEGFALDIINQLAQNGLNTDCLDWSRAVAAGAWGGVISGLSGGLGTYLVFGRGLKAASGPFKGVVDPHSLVPTHGIRMGKNKMRALTKSVAGSGVREPVKFVEHNGQRYIVDGHHRIRAAKAAGVKRVPAEEVSLPYRGYRTVDDLLYDP